MDPSTPGTAPPSRAPVIALALAGAALVLAAVTTVVVLTRGSGRPAAEPEPAKYSTTGRALVESRTSAEALVAAVWGDGVRDEGGVVVVVPPEAFGLQPGDQLLSIAGRPVTRASTARIGLRSVLRLDTTAVLFDVMRAGKPLVVRVEIDGNLRAAIAAQRSAAATMPSLTAVPGGGSAAGAGADALDLSKIVRRDDTHVEVPRALVDAILANPMAIASGARVVPSFKNGASVGFKLYAVRQGSLYERLGLQNGDTVTAVDGVPLTTMDQALEMYTRVRGASRVTLSILRRGQPVELTITVT